MSLNNESVDVKTISELLDDSLLQLPVDITKIVLISISQANEFLKDNVLNRLIVTLLNEQDRRISNKNTKLEVLMTLNNVAKSSRATRSALRICLFDNTEWFDENFFLDDIIPEKDPELVAKTKLLFAACWKIRKDDSSALVNNYGMSIESCKQEFLRQYAATQFQAIVHGFIDRLKLKRYLIAQAEAQKAELREWSAINIQKIARSYIARKTVVRSFKIRKQLSHEVLHIAERYLQGGDVWGFLKEINEELARANRQIADNEEREHNWASNFVQKVIVQRQKEFDGSWERFPKALSEFNGKAAAEGTILDPIGGGSKHKAVAGIKANNKTTKGKNNSNGTNASKTATTSSKTVTMRASQSSSTITPADVAAANSKHYRNVPGPLVRKAVSTTVQVEVANELNRLVNGDFRSKKLAQDIRSVYGPESDPTPLKASTSSKTLPQLNTTVPPPRKKKKRVGLDGRVIASVSKIDASHSADWMNTSASNDGSQNLTVGVTSRPTSSSGSLNNTLNSTHNGVVQPGNTLLLDIPQGLADSIERLLHAAALRCFVPDFFQGVAAPNANMLADSDEDEESLSLGKKKKVNSNVNADASYAYQVYLSMPMGLAKMRYEVECKKYSQGTINKLRLKGLNYLRDVSPVSKFIMCLKSVDAPRPLVNTAVDIFIQLRNIGSAPLGGFHGATAQEFNSVEAITMPKSPIKTARRAGSPNSRATSPQKPSSSRLNRKSTAQSITDTSGSNNASPNKSIVEFADPLVKPASPLNTAVTVPGTVLPGSSSPDKKKKKKYKGGYSNEPDEEVETDAEIAVNRKLERSEVPGQLLLSLVEENGVWCNLKASVEDLLLHAAFLVVAHKRRKQNRQGEWIETESEMGNVSFKEHTKDLLRLDSEEERREAVKERFRAAFILTTPFCLYLKSKRVYIVEDLLSINLCDLQLPPQLEIQIEALLTIVIAKCSNSKLMPVPRDLLSTAKELFTVPMLYDPKFQRSPFDPYGRPPRLQKGGVKVLNRLKAGDSVLEAEAKALVDMNSVASTRQVAMHLNEPVTLWVPKTSLQTGRVNSKSKSMRSSSAGKMPGMESISELGALQSELGGSEIDGEENDSGDEDGVDEMGQMLAESSLDSKWTFHIDNNHNHGHGGSGLTHRNGNSDDQSDQLAVLQEGKTSNSSQGGAKNTNKSSTGKQRKHNTSSEPSGSSNVGVVGQDFRLTNIINDQVFKHSYVCSHPKCNQVFSRLYTYKIHMKSHEIFAGYHEYKRKPQLYLDSDGREISDILADRKEKSINVLPPVIQKEFSKSMNF